MAKKKRSKRVNKKHFRADQPVDIHTGRTPKCYRKAKCEYQKTSRAKSVRGLGKISRLAKGKAQDHHIVPVSVLIAYKGNREVRPTYEGHIRDIDDMYRGQDYCANSKDNLVWLPTKETYTRHRNTKVWDLDLPCHTWGHPAYTAEVLEGAKTIWNDILQAKSQNQCPDPNSISIGFQALEKRFTTEIARRGKRPGGQGTRYAKDHTDDLDQWWHAFSMADDGKAASDPAFSFGRSAGVSKQLLRNFL